MPDLSTKTLHEFWKNHDDLAIYRVISMDALNAIDLKRDLLAGALISPNSGRTYFS